MHATVGGWVATAVQPGQDENIGPAVSPQVGAPPPDALPLPVQPRRGGVGAAVAAAAAAAPLGSVRPPAAVDVVDPLGVVGHQPAAPTPRPPLLLLLLLLLWAPTPQLLPLA